jgi:integrase
VTLNDSAIEILSRQEQQDWPPFVFPGHARYSSNRKQRMATPYKVFELIKARAKLSDLRVHDLRHSYASIAVQSGASLYDVQKMLGHSSPQMTQRYSHLSDDRLRSVSNNVARAVSGTPAETSTPS